MGSKRAADEKKSSYCTRICIGIWKCVILLCLLGTNFVMLYSLTATSSQHDHGSKSYSSFFSRLAGERSSKLQATKITSHISRVHHELELAQIQLVGIRNDLSSFLGRLDQQRDPKPRSQREENEDQSMHPENVNDNLNLLDPIPSSELQEFIALRDLPLGKHKLFQISRVASPVGHACAGSSSKDLLQTFMDYPVGGLCPDDSDLAQTLMLQGCEPLPRRRCFAISPNSSSDPLPFPACLWSLPPDNSILWTHYACKNFSCLGRHSSSSIMSCDSCLDLDKEKHRWVSARDDHDLVIHGVLAMKRGGLRIGLDLGGGSGTFAARMREMGVTIVTTTLDVGAPLSSVVAARGLVPMHVTISQRLPFFDNTMDIVHAEDIVGSGSMPAESFEFLVYDLDRILRPGGLLWLEKLACSYEMLQTVYVPAIDRMGYERVRWSVDSHSSRHVFLTALLEKPVRS
ncbi:hypothetical protein SELMODRAFT_431315 [Selaginella moellendorffii]|uniref:Methyltransferase type 11 domain-containing protein n=1 Tax=Selaginella moellendorffii TaxID=88036 RepID=D8TC71_SELML|nr:uncharacterized protein LOC9652864 [Selaginella moellendorffii]EFJ05735.1 hypothetical protein SELMODRAFT_431315 [Selaginella moellendorffii]|eukprot:XP_002993215.1 uncharacterized protein LOC9652864 [Selaginella moellendorffii]